MQEGINLSLNAPLLLSLTWFALLMSVSPGPNCTVAMLTASRHGLSAVWPHLLGVASGFTLLLIAASLGAHALLLAHPKFALVLKYAGIAYLIWLGWKMGVKDIFQRRNVERAGFVTQINIPTSGTKPTFLSSAFFQFANPKAWVFATATIATYQNIARPFWLNIGIVAAVCAAACTIGIVLWASAGSFLQQWLKLGHRQRVFDAVLGISLIITALLLI
jgi:threonine/homoserine/homoserine lactone efflux protein